MASALLQARSTPALFPDLPFARGYIEETDPVAHSVKLGPWSFRWPADRFLIPARALRVRGWMLMPDGPFERIAAYVNGKEFFTCRPLQRADLAQVFPHIPDAGRAGFEFEIPRRVARTGHLEILGRRGERPIGRMTLRFRDDLRRCVPLPPLDLMERVADTRKPYYFLAHGYKSYQEMHDAIDRHRPLGSIRRLLDWGCGCGRLTAHFLRNPGGPEVHGCDIDREAISWCKVHLPRGTFSIVPFQPPTGYPDGYFDAIIGLSIFTHLTAAAQIAWLREMHRVLAPGGVFAASVLGSSAAWFDFGDKTPEILRAGIYDATQETKMESILGPGIYRRTYQTPEYTRAVFDTLFEIDEYVESGIGNHQDLVVMRKSH